MNTEKYESIFCNECGRLQQHKVAASTDRSGSDGRVECVHTSEILECGGCGYTVLRKKVHFSEFQYCLGDLDPDPEYIPPLRCRQIPDWLASFDEKDIKTVLLETYKAFNLELRFLTAVGIRTALDIILVANIGDTGSFKEKLKKFESDGYVSSSEKERLDVLTEWGFAPISSKSSFKR